MGNKISLIIRYIEILNEWETKFMTDINEKFNQDYVLSEKQTNCINTIHEEVLSFIETYKAVKNKRRFGGLEKYNDFDYDYIDYQDIC